MVNSVYVLKNKNITNSASGAAFPTIIEGIKKLIDDGNPIVYGAVLDEQLNVIHQRADQPGEYEKFRGSKYVQSNIGKSFEKIQSNLSNGKKVLFTGTPCQVYAVASYMKNHKVDTTNLFLVDIICHGAPSPKYWNDFKAWLEKEYNSKLKEFSFRYQQAIWKEYPVMGRFENGKQLVNSFKVRMYTKLFFTHLIMRESCYSCKFANINRISDLTIGDFWGIEKVLPEFPFHNSVSEVLVSTKKGQRIIDNIHKLAKDDLNIIIQKCDSDEYIQYQHNLQKPTEKPASSEQFKIDYEKNGFEYVLKKYAGYNLKGRLRHSIVRFLKEIGIVK